MSARFALLQDASGAHDTWTLGLGDWIERWSVWGPWLLAALVAFLCLRAWTQRGRYRALSVLGPEEQRRVVDALEAAEKRTVGEIVPVVLERSDRFPGASWLSALIALVVGTLALVGQLPWHDPVLVLLWQIGLGMLGYGLAELVPGWKRLFVSEARASEMAEEQALQEFLAHGLIDTEGRTGVLILVSLFERRVVVLGDKGIAEVLAPADWEAVDRAVLEGVRAGRLADGLVEAIRLAGEKLAESFPWTESDRDELPNRLIVRRE